MFLLMHWYVHRYIVAADRNADYPQSVGSSDS